MFTQCWLKEYEISISSKKDAREDFKKTFITKKLQANNWNISKAAEELEIERSNLYKKNKSPGIETQ